MMKELIQELIARKIHLSVDKGQLVVDFQGKLPEDLIEKIKANKENLISYLDRYTQQEGYAEIPRVVPASEYQVSSGQRRLWLLSQFEDEFSAYNIPTVFLLDQSIDRERLLHAIKATVQRHEILRTVFKEDVDGNVVQCVLEPKDVRIEVNLNDFSNESDPEEKIRAFINADKDKSFDLTNGPLFRVSVMRSADERYMLYLNMHHIIGDGWSLGVLSRDILTFYEAFEKNQPPNLEPLRIQYKDYAAWQQEQIRSERFKNTRTFWLNRLGGELPLLDLAGAKQRPKVRTNHGKKLGTYLNPELTKQLKRYVERQGGSLFMVLLAGWKLVLYTYSNQKDLVVGTPVAGRSHANLENQIGFYVNTLALRTVVNPRENFDQLYQKIKMRTLESFDHQMYPFDQLLEDLEVETDTSRNPVFDAFLMLLNTAPSGENPSVGTENGHRIVDLGSATTKFDVDITFQEQGECISAELVFNADIYSEDLASGLLTHFRALMSAVLEKPSQKIGEVDFLSDQEKHQLLTEFNQTDVDYPKNKTIHELFEDQVDKHPDRIAIVQGVSSFSYEYINRRANKLANYLSTKTNVEHEDLVGIRLARTVDYVIALLGILKAGATCSPINPDLPPKRLGKMIENFKLIVDHDLLETVVHSNEWSEENPCFSMQSSQLAYILFTSGSTGEQKAGMIEHKGVVNHVFNKLNELTFDETTDIVHASKMHFVGGIWQLWAPLFVGAKVILPSLEEIQNIASLLDLSKEHGVRLLEVIPSQIANLLALNSSIALRELDRLILTGEPLKKRILEEVFTRNPDLEIINTYGITETSDVITSYSMKSFREWDHRSVGKPIQNMKVFVLNENKMLCPIGVDGEIYVAGDGVARGYLNQAEFTAERFITHPLIDGQRLYRTGDLGRWTKDGELLFLGRIDHQVHIRGFRIELREIEQAVLEYSGVLEAVVLALENDQEEMQLAVYFTAEEEKETNQIRAYLGEYLPHYMLPNYYVQLPELPLTKNGKLDRKALPDPKEIGAISGAPYVEATSDLEKQLVEIWHTVLNRSNIGIDDDFFALGGHSLKAVRLSNAYEQAFQIKLSLPELFQHKTIRAQQALLLKSEQPSQQKIVLMSEEEREKGKLNGYPLSDAQRRLWILSQFPEGSIAYNSSGKIFLTEAVNENLLRNALEKVVERHEILRTYFREDANGELRQWVVDSNDSLIDLTFRDFSAAENQHHQMEAFVHDEATIPFNLEATPLFRVGLIKLGEENYVFYYILHHIISDGWSMEVLSNDVFSMYQKWKQHPELTGDTSHLTPLEMQYRDYAVWQLNQVESEEAQSDKSYWLQQLGGVLPVINLPANQQRPKVKTFNGQVFGTFLNEELTSQLKNYATKSEGTMFMALLSAWNILVYRYTGEEDISTGTPIAGREQLHLENQIGCYVNTLVIRNQLQGTHNFKDVFEQVKLNALNAFAHQSYAFDRLVEDLKLKTDRSRNPVFDISMTYHNQGEKAQEHSIDSERITRISDLGSEPSKNDLEWHIEEVGDLLAINVKFNPDVYDQGMITRLMTHFKAILKELVEHPSVHIDAIDFLSDSEKKQLLEDFNQSSVDLPANKTLVDLFREQAQKSPNQIAVVFDGKELTYDELDKRSSVLASTLHQRYQLNTGSFVGIQLERSDDMVLAILGVLKTGAAYVPIDPDYPGARREYMLKNSGAEVLITHTNFLHDLDFFEDDIFALDVELDVRAEEEMELPAGPIMEDPAYVIYTSGSTGRPKGVVIQHKAIVNTILSQIRAFEVNASTKGLQFASYSFDASVWETFILLIGGGTLEMIKDSDRKNPNAISDFVQERGINWVTLPPSILNRMDLNLLKDVKQLITAGEAASTEVATAFSSFGTYYNAYGPTETSICATVFEVKNASALVSKTVPIGKPVANTEIFILSNAGALQPIGVVGEIGVAGKGVAAGYLKEDELTDSKFVPHPFRENSRMYKTGDLGKWTDNGNVIFVGRKDDQVKVRGHRVEPDEITNVLLSHREVEDGTVVAREIPGDVKGELQVQLVAYFSSKTEKNERQVQQFLQQSLPEYMVPAFLIQLSELPVTINGKIDKKQLPNPLEALVSMDIDYVEPSTKEEAHLIDLWGRTLGISPENIGINHRFFELGGDSISALRLIGFIRKELGLGLSVADVYNYDSVAELVRFINENQQKIESESKAQSSLELLVTEEFEQLKEKLVQEGKVDFDRIVDLYPMSDIEKGMVFGYLMNEGAGVYHDQIIFQRNLTSYDHTRLKKALQLMIEKHDILRTTYNLNDYDQEIHFVQKEMEYTVGFEDVSMRSKTDQEHHINSFLESERKQPFDCVKGPLWRMDVFKTGRDAYLFVFQCLHSIIDGWSDASFMTELNNCYHHLEADDTYQLNPLKASYRDFVVHNEISKRDVSIQHFWKEELRGFERLDIFTSEEHLEQFRENKGAAYLVELEGLAKQTNTSVKVIALAAYLYLLKVLNYDTEVVTGLVTNARPPIEDGDKMLGCFLNTIPLRTEVNGELSCKEYLDLIERKLVELKSVERLSLLAISEICIEKSKDANPFFDVLFNYVDFHVFESAIVEANDVTTDSEIPNITGHGRTNTFFDFIVSSTGGQFSLDLSLRRKLKSDVSLESIGRMYTRILDYFVQNPLGQLSDMSYLTTSEIDDLKTGSVSEVSFPKTETLVSLFESQASATPNNTAVIFPSDEGEKRMSYAELDALSNQMAHYLKSNYAITANDLVGIKLERSAWIPVVMLGILKSGGAYVPIDPASPEQRVSFIEKDTGCKLLMDQSALDNFLAVQPTLSSARVSQDVAPNDLAYIIYTSGTTGMPKGVQIDHHNVVRLFKTDPSLFDFSEADVWTMFHSYAFDFSVWEMYGALLFGGQLVIIPQRVAQDTSAYLEVMERYGVTVLNQTPSAFYGLSKLAVDKQAKLNVRMVIFGGEALSPGRLSAWHQRYPSCALINMYGITEATVHTTYKQIDGAAIAENRSNIGKAIPTVNCLVLDQHRNLVPVGVSGELYIGGEGVAQGYLNREELTQARFVENPYNPSDRLYRTGDKVRMLSSGDLEYLGRIDDQVKIRGYRIELGEVEHALLQHASITDTVVIARPNEEGTNELIAYVVSSQEETVSDLRSRLRQQLPDYMLPSYFVQLDELPLNNNGKVDKKALPQHNVDALDTGIEYVEPRNDIEEKLTRIWEKVLKKEKIGIKEDFFMLGGNSIKAMKIIGAIQDEFNHTMEIRKIFSEPTIENIALDIENAAWMKQSQNGTEKKKITI